MIKTKLHSTPLPLQIPVGREDSFTGIVDIVKMKAFFWTDETGVNFDEAEIPEELHDEAQMYREQMIELLAEHDDCVMEKFVHGEHPGEDELKQAIRNVTISSKLFPVFCGSALKNKGVQAVLDAVVDYLPSPKDIPPVQGHDHADHDVIILREAEDREPFCGLVFKIRSDSYVGKLSYIRVYSGHIKAGDVALNITNNKKERIGRILRMHANDREDIKEIYTGDIVALVGMKTARTGDTLCDADAPILLEKMTFPEPVISIAIEPKTKADQDKLSSALSRLEEEDPTFLVKLDPETGQNIISGMGELHLDIITDRLTREFNVKANVGKPQVAYKETITKKVQSEYTYEKQIAGKDQYGHVIIELEPLKPGSGFIFENKTNGIDIPEQFIPSIENGIIGSMEGGVVAGYKVMDVKVSLIGGSFDDNASVDVAYRIAATMAFRDGAKKADPALLEPIMKLEIISPDEYTGDIINDVNSRRGRIEGIDMVGALKSIHAVVPLSEMFGYATSLRSMSQGRATNSLEFSHYEVVPAVVMEKLIGRMTGRNF